MLTLKAAGLVDIDAGEIVRPGILRIDGDRIAAVGGPIGDDDEVIDLVEVFTAVGTYSAFGDTFGLAEFPSLSTAPQGLFMTGTALVSFEASGVTASGTRAMTFLRRNGAHDSGRPHAYERP